VVGSYTNACILGSVKDMLLTDSLIGSELSALYH